MQQRQQDQQLVERALVVPMQQQQEQLVAAQTQQQMLPLHLPQALWVVVGQVQSRHYCQAQVGVSCQLSI